MTDLAIINNSLPVFQNEKLNASVHKILAYSDKVVFHSNQVNNFAFAIALELKHIKDEELHKEAGFSNILEFASEIFGYQKTTTYYLLKLSEDFLVGEGEEVRSIFARDNQDFSVNQLRELTTLDVGKIEELVEAKEITPTMTIKEIRSAVRAKKKNESEKNSELKEIPDVGKTENSGIISDEENKEDSSGIKSESISSSLSGGEHELKFSSSLSSVSLSSLSSSSLSGEEHELKEESSENASINHQIAPGSTDSSSCTSSTQNVFAELSRLFDREFNDEPEEFPSVPYEFSFFDYREEKSVKRKLEEIRLDELVLDTNRLPRELKDYIELLQKEIKRLNHFDEVKSTRIKELEEENKRLKEENYKLAHPIKRKRGRPRKER